MDFILHILFVIFAYILMGVIFLGAIYWIIMVFVIAIQIARGKYFGRLPW